MNTALSVLRPGAPTSIGSLPHRDPATAATFILRLHAELPAAPQLPARTPSEGMLAQVAAGVPGISLDAEGGLVVDRTSFDPDAPVVTSFDTDAWAGMRAFLGAVKARRRPVKLQLTGPITLATALARAGVDEGVAVDAGAKIVRAQAKALVEYARAQAPLAPLVVFLDEPSLTGWHLERRLPVEPAVDALSGALASLGPGVITGVHCCGPTDWRLPMGAGPDILSVPLGAGIEADAAGLGAFLDGGGWVAWGAVPTDRPVGEGHDRLWRQLVTAWCELTQAGCDPAQLRLQSLVTPACGLVGHGVTQAERVLTVTSQIAERVEDQAVGARLIIGA